MGNDELKSGWNTLDHLTGGFGKGELIVIAARPGVGKTSFAMEIVRRVAVESAKRIVVFALEMTRENFAQRLLSQFSGVNLQGTPAASLKDEQWSNLQKAAALIGETGIFIDDTPALTGRSILERCGSIATQEGPIDLVIVDYLQLMRPDGSERDERDRQLADICRSLKRVAKELDCPVMLACQLSRTQVPPGSRPTLRTVREIAPIEASSDTLLLLHRDDDDGMECIVGKARNGANGLVRLNCKMSAVGLDFGKESIG